MTPAKVLFARLWFFGVFGMLCAYAHSQGAQTTPYKYKISYETISQPFEVDFERWYDFEEGINIAQKTHRPLMLYFWHQQCPFCQRLNAWVLSRPEVRQYLAKYFVIVSIITLDEASSKLVKDHRVGATPTVIFSRLESDDEAIPELQELWRFVGSRSQDDFMIEVTRALEALQP